MAKVDLINERGVELFLTHAEAASILAVRVAFHSTWSDEDTLDPPEAEAYDAICGALRTAYDREELKGSNHD